MSINALDPAKTALLVMDLQADIVARFADGSAALLERTATLIAAARAAHVPVIYVVVGFRPGYPEVSPRNQSFSAIAGTGRFTTSPPGADIVPAVRPQPEDVIIVKHRVGAFSGTDLDMILRAKGVETLVLTGLATSGVVLSTVRHGADADYRLVVVKDCCGDGDDEVHRVLTEKVFVRQASVVAASELAFQK
jgi:nicotinamidase-related amidase